jgi:hypothetical protein
MNSLRIISIKKEVSVAASQETAFKVFTGKMDAWWPRTHHVGMSPMVSFVLEPRVNGRWYTCDQRPIRFYGAVRIRCPILRLLWDYPDLCAAVGQRGFVVDRG